MARYNKGLWDSIVRLVMDGNSLKLACEAVGEDIETIKNWMHINTSLKKELKKAQALYIADVRNKMQSAKTVEDKEHYAKLLEAVDPDFTRFKSQEYKKIQEKGRNERDKKTRSLLSKPEWGFAGWSLRKRQVLRALKDNIFDEKTLKTIWLWSQTGKDRRDLRERYLYETKLMPLLIDNKTTELIDKIQAVLTGKRKLSNEDKTLLTRRITSGRSIKNSPFILKSIDGQNNEIPAIEIDWRDNEKRRVAKIGSRIRQKL